MPDFEILEPALVPSGKPTFLLDWEITMKCNLDCSYCGKWGHDNSTQHPPLEDCLNTVDFMFEYVDLYLRKKAKWGQEVILNVYGGESLFHPNIEQIYQTVKQKHAAYSWPMTVTTTTNLIVGPRLLDSIIPYIDEFTCSYHTESTDKQQQIFRDNLLRLQAAGKRFKVVILLHSDPELWNNAVAMIDFCKQHNMKHLPRQLDKSLGDLRFNYNEEQLNWFSNFYSEQSFKTDTDVTDIKDGNLSHNGRACCGGRQVCLNKNYKERQFYVKGNHFKGWTCSVNWFFLYIKQRTGDIYVNKDCKMNFDGIIGPIGNLNNTRELLDKTRLQLENGIPFMTCAKEVCFCGLCAPKAKTREQFAQVFSKYVKQPTS